MMKARSRGAIEIAAVTLLVLSYLWFWRRAFPGHALAFTVLLLALLVWGHHRRDEGPARIGFRLDNLMPGLVQVVVFLGPLVALVLLLGGWTGGFSFPSAERWPVALAGSILVGLAQQYVLCGFYYRRFAEVLPPHWPSYVGAALIFGLAHMPNPFLLVLTPPFGVLSCWLYRRVPNLYALGLGHGVLSFCLYFGLPRGLTFGLRVGASFWGS